MKLAGVHLGTISPAELDAALAAARAADLTYDHVGSTLDTGRWQGRAPRTTGRVLGHGEDDFAEAVRRLRAWAPQRHIGAVIHPPGQAVEPDATVLVVARVGPFRIVAPNRIVEVVDEERRFAFAYGTLPGHPVRGEESFTIELRLDGTVAATIRVDAAPGTVAARVAGPVGRRVQRAAVDRYLDALVVDA